MAFHLGGALAAPSTKRYVIHHAGGGYSRSPADISHQPFVKREAGLPGRVVLPGQGDLAAETMIGPEARRDSRRTFETEPQQSRACQQNKSQGDLGDGETVAQTLRGAAGGSTATLRLEPV